jgi:hypothetical protein
MWYPFFKNLQEHGMIYYFGLTFVIVLSIYKVIASIVEGKIIETLEKRK